MSYRKTIATLATAAATIAGASGASAQKAAGGGGGTEPARAAKKDRPSRKDGGGSTASPQLEAIARCESGGDPRAIGGGGTYRGKYQFTYQTWASVGGSGDPAAAPESEQDRRAAKLLEQSGSSPWPVCG